MVDVDAFWAQVETVGEFVCAKGCSPPHNSQRCVTSAESSVRRSLTAT